MNDNLKAHDTDRRPLNPPTFVPPSQMREKYLQRRRNELETLLRSVELEEWKSIMAKVNHVRGTGAMYGFAGIGGLADELVKAVQNREPDCHELMAKYVKAVKEAYV